MEEKTRNYARLVPREPPKGMVDWLKEQGKLRTHALLYKAAWVPNILSGEKERMVEVRCSCCRKTMYADRMDSGGCNNAWAPAPFGFWNPEVDEAVISGDSTMCPMCGEPVKAVHISDARRGKELEDHCAMTIDRLEDKLVLTGWRVSKLLTHEGEEEINVWPWVAYVAERNRMIRLMGYQRCLTTVCRLPDWGQRKTYMDEWGRADLIYPWDPEILKGTQVENCKLDVYLKGAKKYPYPVSYLRLWQKHRNVENLVTQGCGYLVGELIWKECDRSAYERAPGCPKLEQIHWKERRPSKMLGLTGEEFAQLRKQKWTWDKVELLRVMKEKGVKLKLPRDLEDCWNAGGLWWCEQLADDGLPVLRSVRYLLKQKKQNKHLGATILKDYWDMAEREGWDLTDDHIRYPKDLKTAHDRVNQIQQERLDMERRAKLAKEYEVWERQFRELLPKLEPFAWERDGILIRPAETPDELDQESKVLDHCVRTYKDTHAEGKKPIFFVRRAEAPEKPWYTLQLDMEKRKVLQNRGKWNCERTKEVWVFEKAWVEHIQAMPKPNKEDKKAS